MEWIVVLLAGGAIGIWHERDKARAAIPVPGYEMGRVVPAYVRKAQAQENINRIATQAVMVAGTVREPKATSDSKCLHLQSVAEAGEACHGRYGRFQ